jgi:hypothetical protein
VIGARLVGGRRIRITRPRVNERRPVEGMSQLRSGARISWRTAHSLELSPRRRTEDLKSSQTHRLVGISRFVERTTCCNHCRRSHRAVTDAAAPGLLSLGSTQPIRCKEIESLRIEAVGPRQRCPICHEALSSQIRDEICDCDRKASRLTIVHADEPRTPFLAGAEYELFPFSNPACSAQT